MQVKHCRGNRLKIYMYIYVQNLISFISKFVCISVIFSYNSSVLFVSVVHVIHTVYFIFPPMLSAIEIHIFKTVKNGIVHLQFIYLSVYLFAIIIVYFIYLLLLFIIHLNIYYFC